MREPGGRAPGVGASAVWGLSGSGQGPRRLGLRPLRRGPRLRGFTCLENGHLQAVLVPSEPRSLHGTGPGALRSKRRPLSVGGAGAGAGWGRAWPGPLTVARGVSGASEGSR